MSHLTVIKVEVRDLKVLERACARLGMTFHENVTGFRSYRPDICDHKLSHPAARYDVGVRKTDGGGYTLHWDPFSAGGLVPIVGEGAGKLIQAYAIEAAIGAIQQQGYSYEEVRREDGSIQLEVAVTGY